VNDAAWCRAMARTLARTAEERRRIIGNEITAMMMLDVAEACVVLAAQIDADDARDRDDFTAEARTARVQLSTQPGVAAAKGT
jgi:hypothetical protein